MSVPCVLGTPDHRARLQEIDLKIK